MGNQLEQPANSNKSQFRALAILGVAALGFAIFVLTPNNAGYFFPSYKGHFLFIETILVYRVGIALAGLMALAIFLFGKRIIAVSGFGCIAVLYLFQARYLFGYTVDDAFITYRFAEHLAYGHGIVWNLGQGHFEGYSNFLWLIILALIKLIGQDMIVGSKLLGLLFGILTMREAALISRRISGEAYISLFAALSVALTTGFVQWACAGLETAFFLFLLLYSLRIFSAGMDGKASLLYWSAAPFFLMSITRIEGPAYFAVIWMLAFVWSCKTEKPRLKPLLILAVIFTALYGSYYLWRFMYFGTLFPNVVYAKGELNLIYANAGLGSQADLWRTNSLHYIKTFVRYYFPFIIMSIYVLRKIKNLSFLHIALLLICITNLLIVAGTKPVMGHWFRHLFPSLIIFYILSVEFIAFLVKKISLDKLVRSALPAAFLLVLVAFPAKHDFQTRRFFYLNAIGQGLLKDMGLWARKNFEPQATLAAIDCGETPYYSGLKVLDLWGLNDHEIARNGVTEEYFYRKSPDIILFRSSDPDKLVPHYDNYLPILGSPLFEERYEFEKKFESAPRVATFFAYVKKDTSMRRP